MTLSSHMGQEVQQVAEEFKMFLQKTVQDHLHSLIQFFLF